ncbi:DgyrCDS10827 [Dimorphilus gyrociliatus]|uniref:DgyrCDS10827 n=1 Tax=Dimorphilus gyrociliatus TaxID=2664684 RepID=A0A7I8W6I0_9ANNE|nr:DgyrCDS10827 [Dimorphilus gyrociliatus]
MFSSISERIGGAIAILGIISAGPAAYFLYKKNYAVGVPFAVVCLLCFVIVSYLYKEGSLKGTSPEDDNHENGRQRISNEQTNQGNDTCAGQNQQQSSTPPYVRREPPKPPNYNSKRESCETPINISDNVESPLEPTAPIPESEEEKATNSNKPPYEAPPPYAPSHL